MEEFESEGLLTAKEIEVKLEDLYLGNQFQAMALRQPRLDVFLHLLRT